MKQIVLEGDTLGKRHRYYNNLVQKTENLASPLEKLCAEDNDVDNLYKIDVACNNRNVEYILEVLKSEDMLYVSRAIKRSSWLITNPQYSDIINPKYLHTELFPQMTAKAISKFMLHIRLNLKDELRADDFFKYEKKQNSKIAHKWLPICSVSVIEKEIEEQERPFDTYFIKRLSERSITVIEKHLKKFQYIHATTLSATMFLLNNNAERYLEMILGLKYYEMPKFGARATKIIMEICPQIILNNFEKFCDHIDLKTFAKHFKGTDIKEFLLKQLGKNSMKGWFYFDNLVHFAKCMPKEGRFEFLKKAFIDKTEKSTPESNATNTEECFQRARRYNCPSSNVHLFRWYLFAPFDVAFPELKKLIRNESSPMERCEILLVLLTCTRRNLQQVHTVLQYYHNHHINEPFKYKAQFINKVITFTKTHAYELESWNILNYIFHSMEVYTESDNNEQLCIQAIIIYNIVHNEKVPEIIENKFIFDTLKLVQYKLNEQEKDKVFNYLQDILKTKINNINIQNETQFVETIRLIEKFFTLLMDWKKELLHYPWVIDNIKALITIKNKNSFHTDMSCIYNKNKSWRKHMFEESLMLNSSEMVCINALKHDSDLLRRNEQEVDALRRNDNISMKQVLNKLRTYWSETLANEWTTSYLNRLEDSSGHSALVRAICILVPLKELTDIIKKYAPTESKISWTDDNDNLISLRKQIAQNMYLARPLPPPDVVLLYSHGDYLQYALPSLNAILYNMSVVQSRESFTKFLNAPPSLLKHGLRLAFTKLKSVELTQVITKIWKSNKNATIRAVLFRETHKLLCKENDPVLSEEIWGVISMFIDDLSEEEDRLIYTTFGKVRKVPIVVRAQFCMKGYKYLKSLPAKTNCDNILTEITVYLNEIIEHLDPDFVANVLLESLVNKFTKTHFDKPVLIVSYLLSAKDTETQTHRYKQILEPLWDVCFPLWNVKVNGNYFVRNNVLYLLSLFKRSFTEYVFYKKMNFPVKLFTDILQSLQENLPIYRNYTTIKSWNLALMYIKHLESHKELLESIYVEPISLAERNQWDFYTKDKTWNEIHLKAIPGFVSDCVETLKSDMKSHFASIHVLFRKALESMFEYMQFNRLIYLDVLKSLIEHKDFIECHLTVINILTYMSYPHNSDEEKKQVEEIKNILLSHPSDEIRMHYYLIYNKHVN